jgi:uncharacterized repeat protein (TIGR03847 family)
MPRQVHLHDPVERFVVGTIGMPGERTFYIQARTGGRVTSVVLEKDQVALLAERLAEVLNDVGESYGLQIPTSGRPDLDPLELPLTEEFRVAAIAFGWDPLADQMLFELHAASDSVGVDPTDVPDEDDGPPLLRVRATPQQVVDFIARAQRVVAAGRPPCPFCQQPLDPRGHICPRSNGYRR